MQLYPHWLDGEFVRIASEEGGHVGAMREAVRAVKLHALLGTQFLLNDVQIFDSRAVLELFADHEFREFIKGDTDFLDLRVEPDPRLGDHPYALAARGFSRTQAPGWSSSVFPKDPTPIRSLADEILDDVQKAGYVNPNLPGKAEQAYPEHEKLLNAARHAVRYFGSCDTPQRLKALPGARTSYYEVLRDLAARDLKEEDRRRVEEALAFIDRAIEDPGARRARARVLAVLHQAPREAQERIWNNVVQAWNYATQVTLQPEGGSVGTLRGAVSPAPYFDGQADVLVPMTAELAAPLFAPVDPAHLPCDLDALTWDEIAKARKATFETMQELRRARRSGDVDTVRENLRVHLAAVARIIRPSFKQGSRVTYGFQVGVTLVAVIGLGGSWQSLVSTVASVPLAAGSYAAWQWRRRKALTSTLFQAATGSST